MRAAMQKWEGWNPSISETMNSWATSAASLKAQGKRGARHDERDQTPPKMTSSDSELNHAFTFDVAAVQRRTASHVVANWSIESSLYADTDGESHCHTFFRLAAPR